MMRELRLRYVQAAVCLLCAAVLWKYAFVFAGTEFGEAWLSGTLTKLFDVGFILFVVALILSFLTRRIAAGAMVAASLACIPLYVYLVAPTFFVRLFPRLDWGDRLPPTGLHWDTWVAAGLLSIAVSSFIGFLGLLGDRSRLVHPSR